MGDPAGVGPELVLKAVADRCILEQARPLIYGSAEVLERVSQELGLPLPGPGSILDIAPMDAGAITPGLPDPVAGRAMIECVERAVLDHLAGRVSAVVTAPINKETARLAGFRFPGHTEFIALLRGGAHPVMLLCGPVPGDLRVAPVTPHAALAALHDRTTEVGVRRPTR